MSENTAVEMVVIMAKVVGTIHFKASLVRSIIDHINQYNKRKAQKVHPFIAHLQFFLLRVGESGDILHT